MPNRMESYLQQSPQILLVGDVMLDRYVSGRTERISPEAPVPVLRVERRWSAPGGAANVAMNLLGLGAQVALFGMAGDDPEGDELESRLQEAGVNPLLSRTKRPTTVKTRLLAQHQQMMRIDEETVGPPEDADRERLLTALDRLDFTQYGAVVLSDYNKGLCFPELCESVISKARANGTPVIVDPKGLDWDRYLGATVITPNLKELAAVGACEPVNEDGLIVRTAQKIRERLGIDYLLVTRSEQGMTLIGPDEPRHVATVAQEVSDVSGAGDTVVATLARFVAAGAPFHDAMIWANDAAGCVVRHAGTVPITLPELKVGLRQRLEGDGLGFETIVPIDRAEELAVELRRQGKRIIFTNGCFDLLHPGHLAYLRQARELGDVLIVGLNTDASIKRLKGEDRPINPEEARAVMLSALRFVDHVVLFGNLEEEDTPTELIRRIQPDMLIKGGDNRIQDIPGREHAKETRVLAFIEGYSSTSIIQRARESGMQ
jgi:D-beta-D-heptose 7-phosphate kinase / D-beta-D-heptose 1-phosphate adenosyltransferase